MAKSKTKPSEPGFDEILKQLRDTVARLEDGKLSLDDSVATYETGVKLARLGHELLDSAEKRVELLVQPPSTDSAEETVPFDEED